MTVKTVPGTVIFLGLSLCVEGGGFWGTARYYGDTFERDRMVWGDNCGAAW